MKTNSCTTIDEYISEYPDDIQKVLRRIREVIRKEAPDAAESISYFMPAFKLKGPLLYFGVHTNHISLYPTPSGITHFKGELSEYETSKGTIKFPIGSEIPYDLIGRITAFRVKEQLAK